MSQELSIVVAVQGGAHRLPEVLEALSAQRTPDVEVLVCHTGEESSVPGHCEAYPWVRRIAAPRDTLTPYLWRDGIDAARGRRVALTIVHCQAGPDWVRRLLHADVERFSAVGGALENEAGSDALGWAIFLLRYRRYAPPFEPRETTDLPGDNVVYDREALLPHAAAYREGFWEPEIHALLAQEGRRLRLDPELGVTHANGYDTSGFARQRFRHGIRFGMDRARAMSPLRRLVQLVAAPAVPLIFGLKIVRDVRSRPHLRPHLMGALPRLCLFLVAWAAGEAWGTAKAVFGRGG